MNPYFRRLELGGTGFVCLQLLGLCFTVTRVNVSTVPHSANVTIVTSYTVPFPDCDWLLGVLQQRIRHTWQWAAEPLKQHFLSSFLEPWSSPNGVFMSRSSDIGHVTVVIC